MKYCLYIWLLLTLFTSCKHKVEINSPVNTEVVLLSTKTNFLVGDSMSLDFKYAGLSLPKLSLTSTFGTSLLSPLKKNDSISFLLPENIKQQAGCCHWSLFVKQKSLLTGEIYIKSKEEKHPIIETYLGPVNIVAGSTDFSMLVVSPTDKYDNPVPDNTPVNIKTYYNKQLSSTIVKTIDFIAREKIYAHKNEGKIAVTSSCYKTNSKELSTVILPVLPVNFSISAKRNHDFADGNQIVTFTSSIIKDAYDNTISDGTSVTFIIKDTQHNILNAQGLTIGGIAKVNLLHPTCATNWEISAYVFGAAESNTLSLRFKKAVDNFEVSYNAANRTFNVGPIKSYMQQLLPDGILIKLTVFDKKGQLIQQYFTSSDNGYGNFDISTLFIEEGIYTAQIEALGIEKNIQFSVYESISQ